MANLTRRAMLGTSGGLIAGGLLKTKADAISFADNESENTVQDQAPTKVLGRLTSEVGQRAPEEQPRRLVRNPNVSHSSSSRTPLHQLQGIITPADLHFERHHAGIPTIAPDQYELLIHGMVDRPMKFTLSDLKRFPSVSKLYFIECSGNGGSSYNKNASREVDPQQMDGLTSTSEWTGVPLSTLLQEVGVQKGATWLMAEGGDAAVMARSIPIEKAWDDAMIGYGQNGEAIRPEQGYPARLLLPGWEGNASVKWIRRIEVKDQPTMTRDETSKYTDPLKDGTARQFSFTIDAKSAITFPAYPYALTEPGWWEIQGVAWSGRGRITKVDISTDGGETWNESKLHGPVLSKCHTRFTYPWNWDGKETVLMSRATDETGYVQPALSTLMEARGEGTSYHYNSIRPWKIEEDGRVYFGQGEIS